MVGTWGMFQWSYEIWWEPDGAEIWWEPGVCFKGAMR